MGEYSDEIDIMVTGPFHVLDELCVLLRASGRLVRAEPVHTADDRYAHGSFLIRMVAPADGARPAAPDAPDAPDEASDDRPLVVSWWRRQRSPARRRAKNAGRHRAPRDAPRPANRGPAPGPGRRAARRAAPGRPGDLAAVIDTVAFPPFFAEGTMPAPLPHSAGPPGPAVPRADVDDDDRADIRDGRPTTPP